MEGRAGTFEKVLADFESKLAKAEFVALDTELTGVDLPGSLDSFEEPASVRVGKICTVAERYTLIQLGLTLVTPVQNGREGKMSCTSYNLFAFPYVSTEMRRDPVFMCQPSAMRFNAQYRMDFNRWINEGIPYMSREDEKQLKQVGYREEDLEQKVGLLRLWKMLCAARLPFVVHCPLDLFFLLVAFECHPLPRNDPRALAMMIRQCTPKVYDTAHLHGRFGRFRRLALAKFFEDAKARHEELVKNSSNNGVSPVEFVLQGETAVRYSKPAEQMAHEAGYDSLMTAQLFVYLRAINATRIREAQNKLFLYRSIEYIDLERAGSEGVLGSSMFDLSRVTLLVAVLESDAAGADAPRLLNAAGAEFKLMDNAHILVVLRASGGAAIRKARELASKVNGVESWMPFETWREAQVRHAPYSLDSESAASQQVPEAAPVAAKKNGGLVESSNGTSVHQPAAVATTPSNGAVASSSAPTSSSSPAPADSSSPATTEAIVRKGAQDMERQRWISFLRAVGVSAVIAFLAIIRLRRRRRSG